MCVEQLACAGVAIGEGGSDLPADSQPVGEAAERTQRNLVMQIVSKEGSRDIAAGLRRDVVAVMPVSEGPAELQIAEVIVPGKVVNFSVPPEPNGREGYGAKAEEDTAAGTGDWSTWPV